MSPKVAFFLPTRKGSERVLQKNTRPFAGFAGGLVENKLLQLAQTTMVDEIILSTNDEETIRIARPIVEREPRIRIVPRPDHLCQSSTNLKDLINYVPSLTDADHIVWGHVTTPLADGAVYDAAIRHYLEKMQEGFDSLVSVQELKNFLLDSAGRQVNNNTALPWPRTQDLEPLFEVNHALFIASRNLYIIRGDRLGDRPALFLMDKVHSLDIDWEEDFTIAELMYKNVYGQN